MPRVLRIINRLNLGGITYNVTYLTKFMQPEFETILVSGVKTEDEESSEFILDQYGITPNYIREMKREINFLSDRKAYNELKSLIQKFKPDIVHTHAAKAGTLGRLAAFSCNVPVVVHTFHGHVFHSYFSPLKTKIFIGIERYLAKKSSAIVTISELQKHEICNVFKVSAPEKTHIIPLGFDLSRFRENTCDKRSAFRQLYKIPDDVITVGIIGRFAAIKNHSFFLEAMQSVINRTSQKVIAVLIGDGEEHESILECCRKLNMPFAKDASNSETKVVLTSWIKDIDRALAGLDIVALTSHNEGTPVSLIEAQAAGKAVISTRVGGVENVVAEGQTGFLCNKDDMQSFVNQLLQLVEDKLLRNKMADNGWEHVRNKFHYTRLVSDMKNLYNELLSAKR